MKEKITIRIGIVLTVIYLISLIGKEAIDGYSKYQKIPSKQMVYDTIQVDVSDEVMSEVITNSYNLG